MNPHNPPPAPVSEHAAAARSDPLYARGIVLIMAAGGFWSLGGLLFRLVEEATVWQVLLVRSVTLSLTLFCVMAARHRGAVFGEFRTAGWPAVVGGCSLGITFTGFLFSLAHTTVANAVFILSAAPFVAAPLAWLVLGERVRGATWAAMAVAVVGVGVMVAGGVRAGLVFGNLMALMTAVGFAVFAVSLRYGRRVDMLPTVCVAGVITAVASGVMAESYIYTARDFGLSAAMGVVQIGAGMILFTMGSRHVPAAELTLLSLTEVVLAPIWVWLAMGEAPSVPTLVGGAIVFAAITGRALSGMRRTPPPLGAV